MLNQGLIHATATLTRVIWLANRVLLAVFAAMLLASFPLYAPLMAKIAAGHPTLDPGAAVNWLRLLGLIGIGWGVANDRLLGALLAMIRSARSGDPFVAANAGRLRTVGWALLAMQFLDFALGRAAVPLEMHGLAAGHTGLSPGGWMAVLMVFVLAQVFAQGSAMRADLEGTV
jgi:hypothetical protein